MGRKYESVESGKCRDTLITLPNVSLSHTCAITMSCTASSTKKWKLSFHTGFKSPLTTCKIKVCRVVIPIEEMTIVSIRHWVAHNQTFVFHTFVSNFDDIRKNINNHAAYNKWTIGLLQRDESRSPSTSRKIEMYTGKLSYMSTPLTYPT